MREKNHELNYCYTENTMHVNFVQLILYADCLSFIKKLSNTKVIKCSINKYIYECVLLKSSESL